LETELNKMLGELNDYDEVYDSAPIYSVQEQVRDLDRRIAVLMKAHEEISEQWLRMRRRHAGPF
jgi:hypothetical protein